MDKWSERPESSKQQVWVDIFLGLCRTVGLTGAVFFLIYLFVVLYATSDQKQQLIQLYLLTMPSKLFTTQNIIIALFFAALLGQRYHFERTIQLKNIEIDRLSAWKTEHQERIAGSLEHTKKETIIA